MERISKNLYYLNIAKEVARRSTCLRRRYGAVIVNHDEIVSTGYNGAPRGETNCIDRQFCKREQMNVPKGERYELCVSVHAEANAIIAAPRSEMLGATLYMACRDAKTGELVAGTSSCSMCKRLIINAGIETVVVRDTREDYRVIRVQDWVEDDESLEGKFGY